MTDNFESIHDFLKEFSKLVSDTEALDMPDRYAAQKGVIEAFIEFLDLSDIPSCEDVLKEMTDILASETTIDCLTKSWRRMKQFLRELEG